MKNVTKKLKKLLAVVLAFVTVASSGVLPTMTTSAAPEEETYEEATVIRYADLKNEGSNLSGEQFQVTGGTQLLTFDSDTYSNVLKIRWKSGVANGSDFKVSFDQTDVDNISNPFGFWVSKSTGDNIDTVKFQNNSATSKTLAAAIQVDEEHDIELGRLKVLTGENAGKYKVYLKFDNELVGEAYVDVDKNNQYTASSSQNVTMSKTIRIVTYGRGALDKFKPYVEPVEEETYEEATVIRYADLKNGGSNLSGEQFQVTGGTQLLTFDSDTYSNVLKIRWKSGVANGSDFKVSFDQTDVDNISNPFGFWVSKSTGDNIDTVKFQNNSATSKTLAAAVQTGEEHDIELGRLRVLTGENAGKYKVYLKFDNELVGEAYVDVDENNQYAASSSQNVTMSKTIRIVTYGRSALDKFKPYVEPEEQETYASYDTVTLATLGLVGTDWETAVENKAYEYAGTSETHSLVFQFGWRPNIAGTDGWQINLDNLYNRNGLVWFKNDHIYTDFGYDAYKTFDPITDGTHQVEFGRLRVLTGPNAGLDYVYLKIDETIIDSTYTELYQTSGGYDNGYDATIQPSYKIGLPSEATKVQGFSGFQAAEQLTDDYDTVTLYDLGLKGTDWVSSVSKNENGYSYNGTSETHSLIFNFGWEANDTRDELMIEFDEAWKYQYVAWFQAEKTYLYHGKAGVVKGGEGYKVGNGRHDVELGRLRVTAGSNVGKDYVYIKIDGSILLEAYADPSDYTADQQYKICFDAVKGTNDTFAGFKPANEAYTSDYDTVTLRDLGLKSENAWDTVSEEEYHYGGTSLTHSLIFKFGWKIDDSVTRQKNDALMIDFDDAYAYNFTAWFKSDETFLRYGYKQGDNGWSDVLQDTNHFVTSGEHEVELGRLRVTAGPNTGKDYVYIKVDDTIWMETYADPARYGGAAPDYVISFDDVVATDKFSGFGTLEEIVHVGVRGELDDSAGVGLGDLANLKQILLGELAESATGVGDYNSDGRVSACDLVVMMKDSIAANSYSKSGSLLFGVQEHLLADESKTADYIADATGALGATAFRLSKPIHQLFNVTASNTVEVKTDEMTALKTFVSKLKAQGVTEILYVSDTFMHPSGYLESGSNHNKTVPDIDTEYHEYMEWLEVNAAAYAKLAEEIPEIKYFEPYNEPNLNDNRMEKNGLGWDVDTIPAAYQYSTKEKAGIMVDLCWNISVAVKSVNRTNQVTTPSLSVSSSSTVDRTFLDEMYKYIESGVYPRNNVLGDKRVDNYFTIINIHNYPGYDKASSQWWKNEDQDEINTDIVNEYANGIQTAYTVAGQHNDAGSRVWLTETGMYSQNNDYSKRDEDLTAEILGLSLARINQQLTFVDAVFLYEIADNAGDASNSVDGAEHSYGLFYGAGSTYGTAYAAKPTAKTVYSFFNNGSTDYSAIDAFVSKYLNAGN